MPIAVITFAFFAIKNLAVFVKVQLYPPIFVKVASEIKISIKVFVLIFHL